MSKTPEELLEYTIQMRQRGDSYRTILGYLNRHCDDSEIREKVLEGLDKLEDHGQIQPQTPSKPARTYNAVVSFVLIAVGGVMVVILWKHGWVASFPFIAIAAGLLTLTQHHPFRK